MSRPPWLPETNRRAPGSSATQRTGSQWPTKSRSCWPLSRSQRMTRPSPPPLWATAAVWGERPSPDRAPMSLEAFDQGPRVHVPEGQNTQWSRPPERARRPSSERATVRARSELPWNWRTSRPVSMSHRPSVPSVAPARTRRPSGASASFWSRPDRVGMCLQFLARPTFPEAQGAVLAAGHSAFAVRSERDAVHRGAVAVETPELLARFPHPRAGVAGRYPPTGYGARLASPPRPRPSHADAPRTGVARPRSVAARPTAESVAPAPHIRVATAGVRSSWPPGLAWNR